MPNRASHDGKTTQVNAGIDIPFSRLVGIQPVMMEKGHVTVALDVRPELGNSMGHAHGGFFSFFGFALFIFKVSRGFFIGGHSDPLRP